MIERREISWWSAPTEKRAEIVSCIASSLGRDHRAHRDQFERNLRLYQNRHVFSLDPGSYSKHTEGYSPLAFNLARGIVDSVLAKILKSDVQVSALAYDAFPELAGQAKDLTRFINGICDAEKVRAKEQVAFRDALLYRFGALRVYGTGDSRTKRGDIRIKRVYPWSILVDPTDAYDGEPRSLYQVSLVDRGMLRAMYPNKAKAIESLPFAYSIFEDSSGSGGVYADTVRVVEAWHLPSTPSAKDGAYVMAAGDVLLSSEPWTAPGFPHAFVPWSAPPLGWYYESKALIEEIAPLQAEYEEVGQKISAAHYYTPSGLFAEPGTLDVDQLRNVYRGEVYEGKVPQMFTPMPVSRSTMDYFDRLQGLVYQTCGVSQLSAQSLKPSGIQSGIALQTLQDTESERFLHVHKARSQMRIDLAYAIIHAAQDLAERGFAVETSDQSTSQDLAARLEWRNVSMERTQFTLRLDVTSALPDDLAGRLDKVQSLAQAGVYSPELVARLLDFPDLSAENKLVLADINAVDEDIGAIVERGEIRTYDPVINPQVAMDRSRRRYLSMRDMPNLPPERLQLVADYMAAAQAELAKQAPPAPAEPPPEGVIPQ